MEVMAAAVGVAEEGVGLDGDQEEEAAEGVAGAVV